MKSFVVALCIGIFMVLGCVFYMVKVEDISQNLIQLNNEIISNVEKEDYKEAEKSLKEASDYLEDKLIMLAATGNHTELDQIEIYMSQISEYIAEEHKGDALAHCKSLMIMFKHLPKNYRLKAENIL